MKLPKIDSSDEQVKYAVIGDILFIAFLGILFVLLFYSFQYMNDLNIKDKTKNNTILEATISDIYRSKDNNNLYHYYIIANTESHGRYEIEISKSEFMEYRIDDWIQIKIKNNNAYIFLENTNP